MKLCIRTANRPHMLRRLLDSIARYEPWLLELEIEVSDGSHTCDAQEGTRQACHDTAVKADNAIRYVRVLDIPHAKFTMDTLGCHRSDLKNGYNLWQIMARHKGQEILLLDDDMVFPLRLPHPLPEPRGAHWECDEYRFNPDYRFHHTERQNILKSVIEGRSDNGTIQLCTYGHGVCDDYSWAADSNCIGDIAVSQHIEYANAVSRTLHFGFLTPVYIRKVPEVRCLPPDSPNDDTIMLLLHDFGHCLWSNWQIGHFRETPKPFDKTMVTDADMVNMINMLYHKHASINHSQFRRVFDALCDAKEVDSHGPSKYLLPWINAFLLPKTYPTL